jgi:uncharacterized protein (TIGR02646 family)
MIHVDRGRVPAPTILLDKGVMETRAAAVIYSDPSSREKAFRFTCYRHREVLKALQELFRGKCAFCEQLVAATARPDVEQFRPKTAAVNLDGDITKPGYWWLANEWGNLYLACPRCNRTKMNRFPVAGVRALRPDDDIADEAALLLDPCDDDPEQYLIFVQDGRVASHPPDSDRIKSLDRERYNGHDRGRSRSTCSA